MKRYWAEHAWPGSGPAVSGVVIEVTDGRIGSVTPGPPGTATRLSGLTVPGLANAHSHAFHRALRGRTHQGGAKDSTSGPLGGPADRIQGGGTFWTWRDRMYTLVDRLDPDTFHALARATYAEMALAGITAVGEFHYLHHGPGGTPYDDPNELGQRLVAAAAEAGIRLTLLDTLYLTSTVDGKPLAGPQLRFGDGSLDAWSARVAALPASPHARIGAAAHSVRAVPADVLSAFAERTRGLSVHIHLSEQRAENEACLAVHGRTPAEILDDRGLLGPDLTAVHATHLTPADVARLGGHRAYACFCPTTERDLADGIGPARALQATGARLCLGSDSQAVIDPWEEARALELDERLSTEERGHFTPVSLLAAACAHGALGWPDAGRLAPGARADLVTIGLDSVRTAGGSDPLATAVFAATAADVRHVIVDGEEVVRDGRHLRIDVPRALHDAIAAVWR